ncbi:MAG: hypothetical protein ABW033_03095 [Acidimicrobiia bacterium]
MLIFDEATSSLDLATESLVEGGLVEVGPHADLLARGGRYAAMFQAWQQSHEAHALDG